MGERLLISENIVRIALRGKEGFVNQTNYILVCKSQRNLTVYYDLGRSKKVEIN